MKDLKSVVAHQIQDGLLHKGFVVNCKGHYCGFIGGMSVRISFRITTVVIDSKASRVGAKRSRIGGANYAHCRVEFNDGVPTVYIGSTII